MKRTTLISIMTLAILAVGCGGSSGTLGGGSTGGGGGGNPYDGDWGGTWKSPNTGRSGKISLTINGGGINGTTTLQGSQNGSVVGTISKSGDLTGVVQYPSIPKIDIFGNVTLAGNRITATLTQSSGGSDSPFEIDLKKL